MKQWVVTTPYLEIKGSLLEGPFYDEHTGQARFVDIIDKFLYTFQPSKGPGSLERVKTQETIGVTANIRGSEGDFIVGARDGVAKLDPTTGNISYLCKFWTASGPEEEQRMRCNDGAVDSRGRFWVGTLNDQPTKSSSNPEGILFRVDGDLTTHSILEGLRAPNGIGWNVADDIMYWTDSDDKNIYAIDFDAERGAISNQQVFFHVLGEAIFPDGLAVDKQDCVWSALWGGGKVLRISPDGVVIGEVVLPTSYVTCPAFIGTELLITTRGDPGITENSIKRGGDVYKVDVGVRGASKHDFRLAGT